MPGTPPGRDGEQQAHHDDDPAAVTRRITLAPALAAGRMPLGAAPERAIWSQRTTTEVTQVRAMIGKHRFGGPNDESAIVLLRFESGATAEIVSSVLFESQRRVEVYGEDGAVMWEGTLGPYGEGTIRLKREVLRGELISPYEAELASFVRCIRENREPENSGEEALKNLEILLHAGEAEHKNEAAAGSRQ